MSRYKKILAPTDLSKLSSAAVRYAAQIGLEQNAEVVVHHVLSEDGEWFGNDDRLNPASAFLPRQKERLHEFVKENFADLIDKLKIREVVETGTPYNKIVARAAEEGADLIVMCSHGRTGLSRALIGSVTDKVLRAARCPVLVVPAPKDE